MFTQLAACFTFRLVIRPWTMYKNIPKLTYVLTHNHADLEEMVRHMVFNIKCGSRDDHSKSFSFHYKK